MATSFSQAARAGLTQGGLEGVRSSRTNFEALGDDFQTYEKIGETGDSWSGKTIIYQVYDPYGNPVGQTSVQESGLEEGLKQAAALAAIPLTAGGFGGVLGGALTGGALTGTAASALGNALISGTAGALTGQDPLKAALLSAGLTYGGSLFGGTEAASAPTLSDAQFIAADAAQLASQGLGVDQIEQVLRASGVNTVTAIAAADAATSGMNVDQIAQDITLGNRGLFTDAAAQPSVPTTVTTAPSGLQTVTTTGAAPVINVGGLLAAVPSAVTPQEPVVSTPITPLEPVGLMTPEAPQSVEVTGTAAAPEAPTLQDIIVALTSSSPPEAPVVPVEAPVAPVPEQVTVTAPKAPELTLSDALAALGGAVTAPVAPVVSIPLAPLEQPPQITVTGERAPEFNLGDILATIDPSLISPQFPPQPTPVEQIAVTGTAQPSTIPENVLAASVPAVVSSPATVTTPPAEQITVTGTQQQPEITLEDVLAALSGTVPEPVMPQAPVAPVEQVTVTGTAQPQPTADENLAAAIAAIVNPVTASITTPVTTPTDQVIEVTGTAQKQPTIGDVAAAVNAGALYGPGMTGTQTTVYDKVLEETDSKTAADTAASAAGLLGGLTLTDLLKAFTTLSSLGMLGGGGGSGGGGTTTTTPQTPVPVGNADYYNAVQQYYNTYMPSTPRDVATPLQQWYEGKFGG